MSSRWVLGLCLWAAAGCDGANSGQGMNPDLAGERDLSAPVDLAALPEAGRVAETERLAADHARHRFDLARGPLLDALLVRLEPDRHQLFVVVHHVICDGWSLHLLVREIGELCQQVSG